MGVTNKQYGKSARPLEPKEFYLNSARKVETASSEIDSVLDLDNAGAVRKAKVITGLIASSSARADTGFTIPDKAAIENIALDIQTESTAGTIDVGTPSSESNGDEDGFLAGADITSTGLVEASTGNLGALLYESSVPFRKASLDQGGYDLTYQNSSGPISSDFSANVILWYTEID